MGRLIDADKLLEETRRDRDYAEKNGFLDMYYEWRVLIDSIASQPTAYDPKGCGTVGNHENAILSHLCQYRKQNK